MEDIHSSSRQAIQCDVPKIFLDLLRKDKGRPESSLHDLRQLQYQSAVYRKDSQKRRLLKIGSSFLSCQILPEQTLGDMVHKYAPIKLMELRYIYGKAGSPLPKCFSKIQSAYYVARFQEQDNALVVTRCPYGGVLHIDAGAKSVGPNSTLSNPTPTKVLDSNLD